MIIPQKPQQRDSQNTRKAGFTSVGGDSTMVSFSTPYGRMQVPPENSFTFSLWEAPPTTD